MIPLVMALALKEAGKRLAPGDVFVNTRRMWQHPQSVPDDSKPELRGAVQQAAGGFTMAVHTPGSCCFILLIA